MPTVVLVGTLDTKGDEYAFLRDRMLEARGRRVARRRGRPRAGRVEPDVARDDVAARGEGRLAELAAARRPRCGGRRRWAPAPKGGPRLHADGRLDGILALGGSGGSSIAARAMRALPVGVPKLIVSTVASGDTRPYVGAVDVTMMYSVVDISGVNRVSARIMANAAGAIAGMARSDRPDARREAARRRDDVRRDDTVRHERARAARGARLRGARLPRDRRRRPVDGGAREGGFLVGVLDVTTTELADELVGGVLSAGPDRLEAAGATGLPQVVSLGALDMVNFGPRETRAGRSSRSRNLYVHNPTVTLMRTTPEECGELGRRSGASSRRRRGRPLCSFRSAASR